MRENVRKVPKMSKFMQFWPILGLYDPVKGPFHYQRSMLKGSYSPKSLHKFILPENLSTSKFREVEIKEICPKVVYQVILSIMGPYDLLKSPLHYQESNFTCSYSPKSLSKLVLLENGFISTLFEAKMFKKCPKCHILCSFGQYWDHVTHSEAPYSTNKVHLRAHILPKYSIK